MSNFDDFFDSEFEPGMRAVIAFGDYVKAHHATEVALDDAFAHFEKMSEEPLPDDASPREIIKAVRERENLTTDLVFYMTILLEKLDHERSTLEGLGTALTAMADAKEKHDG